MVMQRLAKPCPLRRTVGSNPTPSAMEIWPDDKHLGRFSLRIRVDSKGAGATGAEPGSRGSPAGENP